MLVHDGPDLVAEAVPGPPRARRCPMPPTPAEAEAAARAYAGFERHFFPGCFVCGPERAAGRRPARSSRAGCRAGTWWPPRCRPRPPCRRRTASSPARSCGRCSTAPAPGPWSGTWRRPEWCWAAWRPACVAPFPAGGTGVAVGWPLGREGRKLYSGTALFGADGRLHGCARQTWIVLAAAPPRLTEVAARVLSSPSGGRTDPAHGSLLALRGRWQTHPSPAPSARGGRRGSPQLPERRTEGSLLSTGEASDPRLTDPIPAARERRHLPLREGTEHAATFPEGKERHASRHPREGADAAAPHRGCGAQPGGRPSWADASIRRGGKPSSR